MADEWSINYLPAEGGRLTGKLNVGDEDVRFSALYDSSNKEIIKGITGSIGAFVAAGGHAVYLNNTATEFELVLPRNSIESARPQKKGLMKRVLITMDDGSEFLFDYGMLSTKNLVARLNT